MYSCQNKIKSICVLGIGMFLGCSNMLFGYDLGEEIYNSFKTVYDKGISVDYLESAYNSEYPADPYLDALNNLDGMQKQVKVAGAQYIEDDLKARNCNLSKKQIWGILYYFVPEFRAEIASSLKKEGGHQASKKKSLDESTIEKYCKKYYLCVQKEEEEYDQVALGIRKYRITASTPKDTMTKCKEYFSNAYKEGSSNEERVQDVNKSRAGNDKFWNATTDDSPYDIMLDLNNIGVFMYEETTEPITPVFYNLPVFSNSAQSLLNNMNFGVGGGSGGKGGGSAGTSVGGSVGGKGGNTAGTSVGGSAGGKSGNIAGTSVGGSVGGKGGVSIGSLNSLDKSNVQVADGARNPLGNNNGGSQKNEDVADKKGIEEQKSDITLVAGDGLSSESVSDVYDDLVDWLGTTSVVDKGILFYGSLCKDEDVEVEPEGSVAMNYGGKTNDVVSDGGNDLSILSEEEYQEMVDYMLSAVDQYSALPEEIQARIMGFVAALDTVNPEGGYNAPATPDTSDEAVSQIKNCVGSCTGLRMDQYLSCVEMCACGERTSKVFDPEGNSGMGPIAKIKFCTVPGMDMSFNEGGRNIISIEEGGKEILGVVDKLSREGKLGIWTKQTNFLDSSTKKMKIGKIISFSISVEGVDLGNKSSESSKQYEENVLERENKSLQNFYEISNSLNDPSHKNKFRMVGYAGENIKDYKGKIDAFSTGTDVNFYGSLVGEAQVDRYISTSEDLSSFLETQARYWVAMKEFMDYMIEYADNLFAKKK